MKSVIVASAALAAFVIGVQNAAAVPPQYESPHIRPVATSGTRVLAVNTPDNRLSVFDWSAGSLTLAREVRVGMDPISVTALDATRAWVVNHLSDDVSVVDVVRGVVLATITVGDEPAHVVFVDDPTDGDGSKWAVVSVSQENRVVVLDAEPPYAVQASLDIPGEDPRAMTVDAAGTGVWVAVFESGNRTLVVPRRFKTQGPWTHETAYLPPLDPPLNPDLPDSLFPDNSVIVKKIGSQWLDEQGGDWSNVVTWDLTDADLVFVDVSTATPALGVVRTGVSTLLYDLTVDANGDVWVAGVDAKNDVYFEPKLLADFAQNVVVKVDGAGAVTTYDPNESPMPRLGGIAAADALAIPNEVLRSSIAGQEELYVTAIGGQRVAVVDPATGQVLRRLTVPEGVSGLVESPDATALILLDRFTNSLQLVNPLAGAIGLPLAIGKSDWDPSQSVRAGRRFLYTGSHSLNGDLACATCHPHANMDGLGWELGDPTGELVQLPPEKNQGVEIKPFHPLKGPMVTQPLRGLRDLSPYHWRGDRADFTRFNPAFVSLLGGDSLATGEMADFDAFILSIDFPPSPTRDHLNQLPTSWPNGGDPVAGEQEFLNGQNGFCVNCHALPSGSDRHVFPIDMLSGLGRQPMKVPQLRNLYDRIGFESITSTQNTRGFGFLHDGQDDGLDVFLTHSTLNLGPGQQTHLLAFLMNFDTGTHAAVGMQATLDASLDPGSIARIDDLHEAAESGLVDLIAHGSTPEGQRGWVWIGPESGGRYQSDREPEIWTRGDLEASTTSDGNILTFTVVPSGQGIRMGVDRDEDGVFDQTEIEGGSDPADPSSQPPVSVEPSADAIAALTRVTSVFPQPFRVRTTVSVYMPATDRAVVEVYDVGGRRVRTLADRWMTAGSHAIAWDGTDRRGERVSPGVYLVALRSGSARHAVKVVRVD